ncbi:MAG TPA: nicotinamide-nucleotide amidohydrolase family protein, partial [Chitinophaga sp.]
MEDMVTSLKYFCFANKLTVAVAESVTGGYLQYLLSAEENASQFFQGGITAFNIGQKAKHLLVEPVHAQQCNCVSQQVADQMALNVCTLFNCGLGIAVTGYAAPVPELGITEMFAYYAVALRGNIVLRHRITA